LLKKIGRYQPEVVALVGVTVWRALVEALGEHELRKQPVTLGFQALTIDGARVAVLPNPSGRNATLTYPQMLAAFRTLAERRAPSAERQRPITAWRRDRHTRAANPRTRRRR
jgi:G:T/U-mismatch repair DNA glycosylase